MPGLRLTPAQAARLLGLNRRVCHRVIEALVGAEFLRRAPDGSIVRREAEARELGVRTVPTTNGRCDISAAHRSPGLD